MNKRGISPLIATVLLIGFSVMMAALVSNYIIKQVKEFDVEKMVGSDQLCSGVNFQIVASQVNGITQEIGCENVDDSSEICGDNIPVRMLNNVDIKNKGSFSIWKLTVNSETVGSYELDFGTAILPSDNPDTQNINEKIKDINKKISFCNEKKVNLVPHIKNEEGIIVECPSSTVTIIPSEMCSNGVVVIE